MGYLKVGKARDKIAEFLKKFFKNVPLSMM